MVRNLKVGELELKIEQLRSIIDNIEIMKNMEPIERHELFNYVANLQTQYKRLTNKFYYGKAKPKE